MNQPQPPKDGMLPVGELHKKLTCLLGACMCADDDLDCLYNVKYDEDYDGAIQQVKDVEALFTAATSERLPASGDEDLRKRLAIFQNYTASWGFPMNQEAHYKGLDIVEADMQKIIITTKQTAVAEERARLVGLLPKEKYYIRKGKSVTPIGTQYAGYNAAITEMRNVLEGKS
jgi:hypothetical protein